MTGDGLQILLVEDSADDAKLLQVELERQGCAPKLKRVQTKGGFLAALPEHSWDAVIADYSLPQFSGLEALKLLRSRGLDIPFIMVSGVFGEDMAVAMMKAGANDYIMKQNLSRLAPALERELEAAHDRRLHKRAESAVQHLAAIVDSSEDAIYSQNLHGLVVSWNPAAEGLFGYRAEEVVSRSVIALFPQNRRDEMSDIMARVRRGDLVGIRETERLHKSGRIIPVFVIASPIKNAAGEITGVSAVTRDITQQKQTEFERQQLIERLTAALHQVRTLTGLLPICPSC